jgi:hypothetical protein
MRALGQINAVHVHAPFEQLLKGLCGRLPNAPSLDDEWFAEKQALEDATTEGSRSGTLVIRLAMGLARFYLGTPREAFAHLDIAYAFRDAGPSVWHIPILREYYALSACALLDERPELRATIDENLAELRVLAGHCAANFAHRVAIVEGELARVTGDAATARAKFALALALAKEHHWHGDVALIHQLAGDREAARAAYVAWGATAVLAGVNAR